MHMCVPPYQNTDEKIFAYFKQMVYHWPPSLNPPVVPSFHVDATRDGGDNDIGFLALKQEIPGHIAGLDLPPRTADYRFK